MKKFSIYMLLSLLLAVCIPLTAKDSILINPSDASTDDADSFALSKITPAIIIDTKEDKTHRWVTISGGMSDSLGSIPKPILLTDGNAGSFSLELSGVDTSTYLGTRMYRDHGHYPMQFQVELLDSNAILISGKTLPYDEISSHYSFDREAYVLEFTFEIPQTSAAVAKTNIKSVTSDNPGIVEKPAQKSDLKRSSVDLMAMLYNAIIIAGAALGMVILVLLVILILKKIRTPQTVEQRHFADVLDTKAVASSIESSDSPIDPDILTPEIREEKIRGLMEAESISYDEAALRVQYESMN